MSDIGANWTEVGAKVTDLGRKLRTHFEQQRAATPGAPSEPAPGAARVDATTGSDGGPTGDGAASETAGEGRRAPGAAGNEGDRVHEALRRLGDAVDGVVEALGSAVKDPTIKDDVKQVGTALTGALSASFAVISDDLRQAFRRMSSQQQNPTESSSPPSGTPAEAAGPSADDGPDAPEPPDSPGSPDLDPR